MQIDTNFNFDKIKPRSYDFIKRVYTFEYEDKVYSINKYGLLQLVAFEFDQQVIYDYVEYKWPNGNKPTEGYS